MSVEQHSGKYALSANCCGYSDASKLMHIWVSAFILGKIWSVCGIMSVVTIVKEANYIQRVRFCMLREISCSAIMK
jgi:hypothetical protein